MSGESRRHFRADLLDPFLNNYATAHRWGMDRYPLFGGMDVRRSYVIWKADLSNILWYTEAKIFQGKKNQTAVIPFWSSSSRMLVTNASVPMASWKGFITKRMVWRGAQLMSEACRTEAAPSLRAALAGSTFRLSKRLRDALGKRRLGRNV